MLSHTHNSKASDDWLRGTHRLMPRLGWRFNTSATCVGAISTLGGQVFLIVSLMQNLNVPSRNLVVFTHHCPRCRRLPRS